MGLEFLTEAISNITWQQGVMFAVGIILIYLGIAKKLEPKRLASDIKDLFQWV